MEQTLIVAKLNPERGRKRVLYYAGRREGQLSPSELR